MDNIVIPLEDFPTVLDREPIITPDSTWAESAPIKVAYVYDMNSKSYIGTKELQPSPLEPGVYLRPPNVLDENPFKVCGELGEKEEYYYNEESKSWNKRKDIFLFDLYSKRTGELINNPIRENYEDYTVLAPLSNYSVWNEQDQDWIIDLDLAKGGMLGSLFKIEGELKQEKIVVDGVEYEGLFNLDKYVEALNTLSNDTDTTYILQNDELLELNRPTLKKIIAKCSEIRTDSLKSLAYFKPNISGVVTLEDLFGVIGLTPIKTKSVETKLTIDNETLLYYSKKLAESLNKKREQTRTEPLPTTNPSMELAGKKE